MRSAKVDRGLTSTKYDQSAHSALGGDQLQRESAFRCASAIPPIGAGIAANGLSPDQKG
jgi:hypothetical protein